jgi:hypothetical protein
VNSKSQHLLYLDDCAYLLVIWSYFYLG